MDIQQLKVSYIIHSRKSWMTILLLRINLIKSDIHVQINIKKAVTLIKYIGERSEYTSC